MRINELKREFMAVANEVCPGFRVLEQNRKAIADIFRWALMLDGELDPEKGLWLYGNNGTGKSTLLPILRKFCRFKRPALPDGNPYCFRITSIGQIVDEFTDNAKGGHQALKTYIESTAQAFDDVGSETIPTYHYSNPENLVQYLLQRRYDRRHNSFTHVTSNIGPKGIKEIYGARIYDRCFEMFNFVEMCGTSFRRKDKINEKYGTE